VPGVVTRVSLQFLPFDGHEWYQTFSLHVATNDIAKPILQAMVISAQHLHTNAPFGSADASNAMKVIAFVIGHGYIDHCTD